MIVIMGIAASLMAISVVSFQTARSRDIVQASALAAVDALRSAQNYAVSGTLPGAPSDVRGYGVYFDINTPQRAILFEEPDIIGNEQYRYDTGATSDTIMLEKKLDIGQKDLVRLADVTKDGVSSGLANTSIFFEKGSGRVYIDGVSDSTAPQEIVFQFKHAKLSDAETKKVTINRITGRIDYSY